MSMETHMKVYDRLLRLYPRGHRELFAEEMRDVFRESLESSQKKSRVWMRELATLPGSLIDAHAEEENDSELHPLWQRIASLTHIEMIAFSLVALILGISVVLSAADRIVVTGLVHYSSLVIFVLMLSLAAMLTGFALRCRRLPLRWKALAAAVVLSLVTFGAVPRIDRAMLGSARTVAVLPGVHAEGRYVASEAEVQKGTTIFREKGAAHLYVQTASGPRGIRTVMVRSGGVDGAYAALIALILVGSAALTGRNRSLRMA